MVSLAQTQIDFSKLFDSESKIQLRYILIIPDLQWRGFAAS